MRCGCSIERLVVVAVLFVCLGNICRSPAAEGILLSKISKSKLDIHIESCGLGDWHIGQLPDERMRESAKNRGIILSSRAKHFDTSFIDNFDLILAVDHQVLQGLYRFAKTPEQKDKVHLLTRFSGSFKDQEIPDPYYGGEAGFEQVLDMIEDACTGLVAFLESNHQQKQKSE
jgi:protein-tyrosine phosphatase